MNIYSTIKEASQEQIEGFFGTDTKYLTPELADSILADVQKLREKYKVEYFGTAMSQVGFVGLSVRVYYNSSIFTTIVFKNSLKVRLDYDGIITRSIINFLDDVNRTVGGD